MSAENARAQTTHLLVAADPLLEMWRAMLTEASDPPTKDPHAAVLGELAAHYGISVEQAQQRCLHWVEDSLAEWRAAARDTPEGLLAFYRAQTSWVFDTLWYHAEQTTGAQPPESVLIAERLAQMGRLQPGSTLLDFGCGPGSTALFFAHLGWRVGLADVSTTMLDMARFRLARRGVEAQVYQLPEQGIPPLSYDVVTACDVLVHVPDPAATFRLLWCAMRPGGLLFFNVDARYTTTPDSAAGFLYRYAYPVLRPVRTAGFARLPRLDFFHVYERLPSPVLTRARRRRVELVDALRYNLPVALAGRAARNTLRRLHR